MVRPKTFEDSIIVTQEILSCAIALDVCKRWLIASKVLSEISAWFFDFQKTGMPPIVMMNPVRDFAVSEFVAGSLL
jgi:hypothetical protein